MAYDKQLIGGLLDIDIEQILNSDTSDKYKYINYNVTLCSPAYDLPITLLSGIEWTRNYNDDIMEDLRVMFTLSGDDYKAYVHDYQDQLELVIEKKLDSIILSSDRYKFFIVTNAADTLTDNINYMTQEQLRKLSPIQIEGQCVTREGYALNDIQIEGIYKDALLDQVMTIELHESLNKVKYQDGSPKIGIDIVPIDNTNRYGHINIPTGMKVLSLPKYLQNHDSYGIYNSGLGRFIQKYKNHFFTFIYPLYDPKQFDKKEDRLIIYHTSHQRAGHYGNTYMLDGKILKIIPQYQIAMNDPKQDKLLQGESVTYTKPDNVYRSYRDIDNGNTLSAKNTNNLVTHTSKAMNDGSIRTRYVGVVSNAYKHRTEVMRDTMAIYQLTWYNSDIDLIYPGMPCMFVTEHNKNGILKLRGIVQAVHQSYTGDKKERHANLTIAVMSPTVLMDNESYKDTNVESGMRRAGLR